MSFQKVILGVLAGATAGATLGILFAPDRGSSTRKRFSRTSYNYTDALGKKFNDLIDNITEQFQTVVEEVNHMAEKELLKPEKEQAKSASAKR